MTEPGHMPAPSGYNLPYGVSLNDINGPETITCPACGWINDQDSEECDNCSYKFSEE